MSPASRSRSRSRNDRRRNSRSSSRWASESGSMVSSAPGAEGDGEAGDPAHQRGHGEHPHDGGDAGALRLEQDVTPVTAHEIRPDLAVALTGPHPTADLVP